MKLLIVNSILAVSQNTKLSVKNSLFSEFDDIFQQNAGVVPPISPIKIKLQPTARPKFVKYRTVIPFSLRHPVNKEFYKLEQEEFITFFENSEWSIPLVCIPKVDGVRLCADYRVTLNKQLIPDTYPILRIEDIFNQVCGSKYYCTFDIYRAYLIYLSTILQQNCKPFLRTVIPTE